MRVYTVKQIKLKPGLVAFKAIQPGNELGLFYSRWGLHRAV